MRIVKKVVSPIIPKSYGAMMVSQNTPFPPIRHGGKSPRGPEMASTV